MDINRRTLIQAALFGSALVGAQSLGVPTAKGASRTEFKRIAVEEAFSTPELMAAQRELLAQDPQDEPGFTQFWGTLMGSIGFWGMLNEWVEGPGSLGLMRMLDLGEGRLEAMDEAGIAMQVLSVTSPGDWVIFEKAQELDVPIYLHPRVPSPDMVKPFQKGVAGQERRQRQHHRSGARPLRRRCLLAPPRPARQQRPRCGHAA